MTKLYVDFYWGIGLGFKQFDDSTLLVIIPFLMFMTTNSEEDE